MRCSEPGGCSVQRACDNMVDDDQISAGGITRTVTREFSAEMTALRERDCAPDQARCEAPGPHKSLPGRRVFSRCRGKHQHVESAEFGKVATIFFTIVHVTCPRRAAPFRSGNHGARSTRISLKVRSRPQAALLFTTAPVGRGLL